MSTRAQLVVLLDTHVKSGNSDTTAAGLRTYENDFIVSALNKTDDLNTNGGYLGIASGRVTVSFINKAVPTGEFLRDDGTWAPAAGASDLATVLAVGNTTGGNNIILDGAGDRIDSDAGGTLSLGTTDATVINVGNAGSTTNFTGIFTSSGTVSMTNVNPFSMTRSQVVTASLTNQTIGPATLTIPNFAGANDEFIFKNIAQSLSNKTLGSGTVITSATMTLGSDATGDVYYRAAGGLLTRLAAGAAGTFLRFAGVGAAPIVSTLVLPNALTANNILYGASTNNVGSSNNFSYNGTAVLLNNASAKISVRPTADTQTVGLVALNTAGTEVGGFTVNHNITTIYLGGFLTSYYPVFYSNGSEAWRIATTGNLSNTGSAGTAYIHRKAGTATASTAPDKYTPGTLLSVIESSTREMDANGFYSTNKASNRYAEGGVIAGSTTTVNNVGTGETDLYTYTTKASTLAATGESIEAVYSGTFNDLTATSQLKIYFAGTVIADTGALTVSATGGWTAYVLIERSGASTASASVNITTPGASTALYTSQTDLIGLTFTNTNIIKITGTAAGATGGNNDISSKNWKLWWWGAANN